MSARVRPWLPALLYMLLIFVLSSLRLVVPEIERFPLKDKGIHFVEYAILGLLCGYASHKTWPSRSLLRTAAVGALVASAWGLSDEIHQSFVPGRSAELLDLVADAIGASIGAGLSTLPYALRSDEVSATEVRS